MGEPRSAAPSPLPATLCVLVALVSWYLWGLRCRLPRGLWLRLAGVQCSWVHGQPWRLRHEGLSSPSRGSQHAGALPSTAEVGPRTWGTGRCGRGLRQPSHRARRPPRPVWRCSVWESGEGPVADSARPACLCSISSFSWSVFLRPDGLVLWPPLPFRGSQGTPSPHLPGPCVQVRAAQPGPTAATLQFQTRASPRGLLRAVLAGACSRSVSPLFCPVCRASRLVVQDVGVKRVTIPGLTTRRGFCDLALSRARAETSVRPRVRTKMPCASSGETARRPPPWFAGHGDVWPVTKAAPLV